MYSLTLVLLLTIIISGCAGTQPIKFKATKTLDNESYSQLKENEEGVVLLDVNWGRKWACGDYENAQLLTIAFDKLPLVDLSNDVVPDLVLQSPSRIFVQPEFISYAYSIPAGEYAISAISIKVASSILGVGFFVIERDTLLKAGEPLGGTFSVNPGETVFIGNFFLDCTFSPTLWRYYPDSREAFKHQVIDYQNGYPFIELNDVTYRLFKTKEFGYNYELK